MSNAYGLNNQMVMLSLLVTIHGTGGKYASSNTRIMTGQKSSKKFFYLSLNCHLAFL